MRGLKTALLLAGTAAALGIAITAAQPQPAGNSVFTADQVTIGQTAYQTTCARCHQADLRGSNGAPPLSGTFINARRLLHQRSLQQDRDPCRPTIRARCPAAVTSIALSPAPERRDPASGVRGDTAVPIG
jgi:mono/diheme cytochrome c family protein